MPREIIQHALQTPDGAWRVEVVSRGTASVWYRIVHGDNVLDWLSITSVERILEDAGVTMAELQAVADTPNSATGAA